MYGLPLYQILIGSLLLLGFVIEFAYRRGRHKKENNNVIDESILELVPTSLLGVLALLLGFTFSMAISRFDVRKRALVKEANAIETAYLRTDFLETSKSAEAKQALKDYLAHRIVLPLTGSIENKAYSDKNNQLQTVIWKYAREMSLEKHDPTSALFTAAINEMFDLGSERNFAAGDHVPEIVYYVIFFIMMTSMFSFSYIYGTRGQSRFSPLLLGFLLTLVLILIQDLDRPARGVIRVDHSILTELQKRL